MKTTTSSQRAANPRRLRSALRFALPGLAASLWIATTAGVAAAYDWVLLGKVNAVQASYSPIRSRSKWTSVPDPVPPAPTSCGTGYSLLPIPTPTYGRCMPASWRRSRRANPCASSARTPDAKGNSSTSSNDRLTFRCPSETYYLERPHVRLHGHGADETPMGSIESQIGYRYGYPPIGPLSVGYPRGRALFALRSTPPVARFPYV